MEIVIHFVVFKRQTNAHFWQKSEQFYFTNRGDPNKHY